MPKKKRHFSLNQLTFAQVHLAIIEQPTLALAVKSLGLGDVSTLNSHISRFILDGEIINFESLKALSTERAVKLFGARYHRFFESPNIQLANYSILHIHHIAMHSKTIREAASKLGTRDHSLKRYLQKYAYRGNPIEFAVFKTLSQIQIEEIFTDLVVAKKPEQRINLTPLVPFEYGFTQKKPQVNCITHALDDFDAIPELLPYSIFGSGSIMVREKQNLEPMINELSMATEETAMDADIIEWITNELESEALQLSVI